ncbi:MAG: ATP-binding cassette domain-containing protein, partial [Ilumatobacteraceae bacterium]|nr:ATP-binding cassette domain-containing protein [Ilumatobacteraceae bacterium]
MADIVLDRLDKTYDNGYHAITELNLTIRDGEFMVMVGPSGCGKSTALRMVAGLEDITGGELRIGGTRMNETPPRDRDIAMVFQSYALYPHLSVYDNIAFGLKLRKTPKDEVKRRVARAADILDLTEYLDRRPRALSGGQRQRVAMGRAIVREPQAFLMDEPLSNLDAKLRGQMRAEIAKLQSDLGVTTMYVTHDQVEAMTMGDRVAVIDKGVLQQVATPRELYLDPDNVFVAGFMGSPPMNMAEVRLDRRGDHLVALLGDATIVVAPELLARKPALVGYAGRTVAM